MRAPDDISERARQVRAEKRKEAAGVVFVVTLGLTFFCVVIWLFSGIFTAADVDRWEQMDDKGTCFLHITDVNNWWLTPGEDTPERREPFCRNPE